MHAKATRAHEKHIKQKNEWIKHTGQEQKRSGTTRKGPRRERIKGVAFAADRSLCITRQYEYKVKEII